VQTQNVASLLVVTIEEGQIEGKFPLCLAKSHTMKIYPVLN
jgi:hypothetical protein